MESLLYLTANTGAGILRNESRNRRYNLCADDQAPIAPIVITFAAGCSSPSNCWCLLVASDRHQQSEISAARSPGRTRRAIAREMSGLGAAEGERWFGYSVFTVEVASNITTAPADGKWSATRFTVAVTLM